MGKLSNFSTLDYKKAFDDNKFAQGRYTNSFMTCTLIYFYDKDIFGYIKLSLKQFYFYK